MTVSVSVSAGRIIKCFKMVPTLYLYLVELD